jgi:hypothetical protein
MSLGSWRSALVVAVTTEPASKRSRSFSGAKERKLRGGVCDKR